MLREFDVCMGDQAVGTARMTREGLYESIQISCTIASEIMYRGYLLCGDQNIDLGILVPEDGAFVLRTRIPMKQLGSGVISFVVKPKHTQAEHQFVPLAPEEPFRYISRLKDSFLARRKGRLGIMIINA